MNTMIKIALAYARYALAALVTVGFWEFGNWIPSSVALWVRRTAK